MRCNDCHKSIHFKPTPRECGGCHGEPDVHRGQLGTLVRRRATSPTTGRSSTPGTTCRRRSSPARTTACRAWRAIRAGGSSAAPRKLCITCHRNDDIHHNVLGPQLRRLPYAAHVGGRALRAQPRRLRAHRRASPAAVRGLPHGRQLHGAGVELRRLPRKDEARGDGQRAGGHPPTAAFSPAPTATTPSSSGRSSCRCRVCASRCADEAHCIVALAAAAAGAGARAGSEGSLQHPADRAGHVHGRAAGSDGAATAARRRWRRRSSSATATCARSSTGGACPATSTCTRRARARHRAILDRRGDHGRRSDRRARLSRRARVRGAPGLGATARRERRLRRSGAWSSPRPTRSSSTALRLWWRMSKHWDCSLYAGAYPDPYSRSLTSDYAGGFAFAGGVDVSYTYDKIWGAAQRQQLVPRRSTTTAGRCLGAPGTVEDRDAAHLDHLDRLRAHAVVARPAHRPGPRRHRRRRRAADAARRAGEHSRRQAPDACTSATIISRRFAIEMWLTRLLADRVDLRRRHHREQPDRRAHRARRAARRRRPQLRQGVDLRRRALSPPRARRP